MERRSIVIVGAGPAGTATALFLLQRAPALASEIVLLDKAVHPRFKVCAGGLIPHTLACLAELDLQLEAGAVRVPKAVAVTPLGQVDYREDPVCTVIRRCRFDALLVAECQRRGVEVRQGERVVDVQTNGEWVRVVTDRQTYRARVVVGADGAGSLVRRRVFGRVADGMGRAVMADIPCQGSGWTQVELPWCELDFRPVAAGLRGYVWTFPCSIDGVPHWNIGVYSSRTHREGQRMKQLLYDAVERMGGGAERMYAHPIPLFDPQAPLADRHVLLVGDAAGVDALLGEGISYAFEFGRQAADCIVAAWQRGDFVVQDYTERVHRSWLGRKLRRLRWLEKHIYGWDWRLWFWLATASTTARLLGLQWYNGIGGIDRLSVPRALVRWWQQRREAASAKRAGALPLPRPGGDEK